MGCKEGNQEKPKEEDNRTNISWIRVFKRLCKANPIIVDGYFPSISFSSAYRHWWLSCPFQRPAFAPSLPRKIIIKSIHNKHRQARQSSNMMQNDKGKSSGVNQKHVSQSLSSSAMDWESVRHVKIKLIKTFPYWLENTKPQQNCGFSSTNLPMKGLKG